MPAFQYTAIDKQGKPISSIVEADGAKQARQQLRNQGLAVLTIQETIAKNKQDTHSFRFGHRISIVELALFTRQLATMLSAAIPLEESLLSVAEQSEKKQIKNIIMSVRSKVMEGYSLADSMAEFPKVFSKLYCSTVAAGEKTGRLDLILERLADFTERQQAIRQKILQASIYPSLIIIASISIVGFLLSYVVPKMVDVFAQNGQVLPALTRVLIGISHFVSHYGLYILGILIVGIFAFTQMLRNDPIRFKWHEFLLKLPLVGRTIRLINTARFAHTLAILTIAGVEVIEAMNVASETVASLPIRDKLRIATLQVREGVMIHRALQQTLYFPPMSIHLIASGENTGKLEAMLERVTANQERDVEATISLSLTLFEPLVILIMGGVVLFIVLAILLPIFDLDQIVH